MSEEPGNGKTAGQLEEPVGGRKLTLEARIINALVRRIGTDEIEIAAEELANAIGVAIYPNEDATKVIVKIV